MRELVTKMGVSAVNGGFAALIAYGEQRMRQIIRTIPNGCYTATEYLDDDGVDAAPLPICVTLTVNDEAIPY
jgi:N-methylhydantoinase B